MNDSPTIQSASGGAMTFTATHWSIVLEAQGETPAAQKALEILCRTYWRPLYGFLRRHGLGREEAQDLIQESFCTPARTQKSGHGPARERTFAFLPACVAQTFSGQRTASRQRR